MADDHAIRICSRVADMITNPPGDAAEDACSMCGETVYVAMAQDLPDLPDGVDVYAMVCTRCVVANPEMTAAAAPWFLRMAKRNHRIADLLRQFDN